MSNKKRKTKLAARPPVVPQDIKANQALDGIRSKMTRVLSEYIVVGYLKGTGEAYWYVQGQGISSGGALAKWATEDIRDRLLALIPPELPEEETEPETSESSTSYDGPAITYYRPAAKGEKAQNLLQKYMVYLNKESVEEEFPGSDVEEISSRDVPNAVIMDKESE